MQQDIVNGKQIAKFISERNSDEFRKALQNLLPVLHPLATSLTGSEALGNELLADSITVIWQQPELAQLYEQSFLIRIWQIMAWRAAHLVEKSSANLPKFIPSGIVIRSEAERVLQLCVHKGLQSHYISQILNVSHEIIERRLQQACIDLFIHVHGTAITNLDNQYIITASRYFLTPAVKPELPAIPPELLQKVAMAIELYFWRNTASVPAEYQQTVDEAIRRINLPITTILETHQEKFLVTEYLAGRLTIPKWQLAIAGILIVTITGWLVFSFYQIKIEAEQSLSKYNFLQKENQIISENLLSAQSRGENNEKLVQLLKTERPDTYHLRGSLISPETDVLVLWGHNSKRIYVYPYYISNSEANHYYILWVMDGGIWKWAGILPDFQNEADNLITIGASSNAAKFMITTELERKPKYPSKSIIAN